MVHIRDILFAVLPVATGIVAYWFAARQRESDSDS